MAKAKHTSPAKKTYLVWAWEIEYKKGSIEAASPEEARRIAVEDLHGEDHGIDWNIYDYAVGEMPEVEEV